MAYEIPLLSLTLNGLVQQVLIYTHLGSGKNARSVVELDPANAFVSSDVNHIPATQQQ